MISLLTGKIIDKTATSLVVDCGGVGFFVNVPFPFAQSVLIGSTITIHIQSVFSQQGVELFGFSSVKDKECFNMLTDIRGIGARAGISILSRLTPDEVAKAIKENRVDLFKTIPGIGPKKAETIVFNLRKSADQTAAVSNTHKDIIQALKNLGFSQKEAIQKLSEVPDLAKKTEAEIIQAILKIGK